jgi:hypothetical protein
LSPGGSSFLGLITNLCWWPSNDEAPGRPCLPYSLSLECRLLMYQECNPSRACSNKDEYLQKVRSNSYFVWSNSYLIPLDIYNLTTFYTVPLSRSTCTSQFSSSSERSCVRCAYLVDDMINSWLKAVSSCKLYHRCRLSLSSCEYSCASSNIPPPAICRN